MVVIAATWALELEPEPPLFSRLRPKRAALGGPAPQHWLHVIWIKPLSIARVSDLHFNVDPDLGGQKKLYLNFEKSVTNVKVNLENLNYDSKMFNKK